MRALLAAVSICATAVACRNPGPIAAPEPEREQRIGGRDLSVAGGTSSELPPHGVELPNIAPVRPAADAGDGPHPQGLMLLGGGAPDAGPEAGLSACNHPDECELTRIVDGACCPTLCNPRAVSKVKAAELAAAVKACTPGGSGCPKPLCRPPRVRTEPICQAGRCAVRELPLEE